MASENKKYKAIIMFGPPGIGKGTQASRLGKLHGFFHFTTGGMFRAMDKESEIGKKVSELIDAGSFVPDNLTVELFLKTLEEYEQQGKFNPKEQVLILDGIPRNAAQVALLKGKIEVMKIIYLTSSDDDVLAERIEKRAKLEGRKDDNHEVLKKRLETYRRETEAVLKKYPKDIVIEIDGFGTIENIYEDMIDRLEEEGLIA